MLSERVRENGEALGIISAPGLQIALGMVTSCTSSGR